MRYFPNEDFDPAVQNSHSPALLPLSAFLAIHKDTFLCLFKTLKIVLVPDRFMDIVYNAFCHFTPHYLLLLSPLFLLQLPSA